MITLALLPIFAFLSLAIHWVIQRNPYNPGVIHGALWLVISLGYLFFQSELNYLTPQTVGALIFGIVSFSIGIGMGTFSPQLKSRSPPAVANVPMPEIIVAISVIGLAMIVYQAIQYARVWEGTYTRPDGSVIYFGVHSWFHMLRFELVSNHKGYLGLGSYVLNFCFAGAAYLIVYYRRVSPTLWLWPTLTLALGFAFVSTGRTYFLLLCCLILGAAMPRSLRGKSAVAALVIIGGAVAFFLMAWIQGRLNNHDSYFIHSPMVGMLMSYFLMPMAAFDHLLNADLPAMWGTLTFRTPLAVLRSLGSSIAVPDLAQPFVKVPAEINVYTVFSPYYRDFGLYGVVIFMFLLGGLHGWVFRQLKAGLPIFIVANAILFYALFLQFFQDQYFSLLSQWIQILFWTYLFNKLGPLPLIKRQDEH